MRKSNERYRRLAVIFAGTTFQCIPGWVTGVSADCIRDQPFAFALALFGIGAVLALVISIARLFFFGR